MVLAFVVFFYSLGSLYDDRRDRSVLFWKSLPVSDVQTVLSKAAWALLLAPLIAIVIGVLVGLALC
ncbi:membrane protein [Xanthomonas arboricola pv. pruni str. MAFF 311562]|uniref:Membrane protein n=1 Tax=Xanthomonas arboricola pv. pruni str. MAFF 311562 TaxID=1414836 RepID=W4S0K4_9XANT|nr:membrane protein [Xanthomonas arboricola pv. pruni str. MAFF 311562]